MTDPIKNLISAARSDAMYVREGLIPQSRRDKALLALISKLERAMVLIAAEKKELKAI